MSQVFGKCWVLGVGARAGKPELRGVGEVGWGVSGN
jgi:hypothetical protein